MGGADKEIRIFFFREEISFKFLDFATLHLKKSEHQHAKVVHALLFFF